MLCTLIYTANRSVDMTVLTRVSFITRLLERVECGVQCLLAGDKKQVG